MPPTKALTNDPFCLLRRRTSRPDFLEVLSLVVLPDIQAFSQLTGVVLRLNSEPCWNTETSTLLRRQQIYFSYCQQIPQKNWTQQWIDSIYEYFPCILCATDFHCWCCTGSYVSSLWSTWALQCILRWSLIHCPVAVNTHWCIKSAAENSPNKNDIYSCFE